MSIYATDWAYPVGHHNKNLAVTLVHGYYQPVADRPTNTRNGYELDLPEAGQDSDLYALLGGTAVFTPTPPGAPSVVNRLVITTPNWRDKETDSEGKVVRRAGLALVTDRLALHGVLPQRLVYDNIDPSALRTKLDALLERELDKLSRNEELATNSLARTNWRRPAAGKDRMLYEWLKQAGSAYASMKKEFLDAVLNNTVPFLLTAADNFGTAAATGAASGKRRILLAAQDRQGQYYNLGLLVDTLVRLSNQSGTELTCLSGTSLYGTPLLTALGVLASVRPFSVQFSATGGSRDIVLFRKLFDWHKGELSAVQWQYATPAPPQTTGAFGFEVRIPVVNGVVASDIIKVYDFKKVIKVTSTKTTVINVPEADFHIRTTLTVQTDPYQVFVVENPANRTAAINFANSLVAQFKTRVDNIGYYLGVPAELMLAVATHESALSLRAVRFEPLLEKNEHTTLEKLRAVPGMRTVVNQYQALTGTGGYTATPSTNLVTQSALTATIDTRNPSHSSLTWETLLNALDTLAIESRRLGDADLNRLISRISPGLIQTLIETAINTLFPLAAFVEQQYGTGSPALTALGLDNIAELRKPSKMFLWLLNPSNSLVAGSAKLLANSGKTKWDLPLVSSYYNDGGEPSSGFQVTDVPNPWGYKVNKADYNLTVSLIYNHLRGAGKPSPPFRAVLKQDISTY